MAIAFIILPLYGKLKDGYVYSVNLLSFNETTTMNIIIYWLLFIVMILIGISELIFTHFDKELWFSFAKKCSVILSTVAICFFAVAREPYVTVFSFLLFVTKIFISMKQSKLK